MVEFRLYLFDVQCLDLFCKQMVFPLNRRLYKHVAPGEEQPLFFSQTITLLARVIVSTVLWGYQRQQTVFFPGNSILYGGVFFVDLFLFSLVEIPPPQKKKKTGKQHIRTLSTFAGHRAPGGPLAWPSLCHAGGVRGELFVQTPGGEKKTRGSPFGPSPFVFSLQLSHNQNPGRWWLARGSPSQK